MVSMTLFAMSVAAAQTNVATTIGQFLLIEPSARISAMGNAGSTFTDEPMAAYYNPASLGNLPTASAQFTHAPWLGGITYNYALATVPMGTSALMLSVTSLRSGDIAVRTVQQPLGTGEYYTVSNISFGLGYGLRVTDRIAAGVQVSYLQETIWHSSVSAMAVNLGTQYRLTDGGVTIGASLSNFGTRDQYRGRDLRVRYDLDPETYGGNSALPAELYTDPYGLPILFRVGLSLPVSVAEDHRLLFVLDAQHPNNNTESISFGGEYTYAGLFAVRAGYQNLFEQDSEVGLTAGAGLLVEALGSDLRMDYAWTEFGRLGHVQRITIGFSF
jgi:long-subunit fatty acid transport protein